MVTILQGALVETSVATLRDASTSTPAFRNAAHQLGVFLAAEVQRQLPTHHVNVRTPLEETTCSVLNGSVVIIPILRAGLGLLPAFLRVFQQANVGFIGLRRNESTLQAEEYYYKVPPIDANTTVIVIDPMLATGGSMTAAISRVSERHSPRAIIAACLVAAPQGVSAVRSTYPDVSIVLAQQDRELNTHGYIVPGLGDAGDRLFGTL
jgi:uracil phosphoribosyltransferase